MLVYNSQFAHTSWMWLWHSNVEDIWLVGCRHMWVQISGCTASLKRKMAIMTHITLEENERYFDKVMHMYFPFLYSYLMHNSPYFIECLKAFKSVSAPIKPIKTMWVIRIPGYFIKRWKNNCFFLSFIIGRVSWYYITFANVSNTCSWEEILSCPPI